MHLNLMCLFDNMVCHKLKTITSATVIGFWLLSHLYQINSEKNTAMARTVKDLLFKSLVFMIFSWDLMKN